jgi:hypothetical protein
MLDVEYLDEIRGILFTIESITKITNIPQSHPFSWVGTLPNCKGYSVHSFSSNATPLAEKTAFNH